MTAQKKHREHPGATRVVFVQGGGPGTHDSWDNRLVASLEQALGAGYVVRYPRMPREADPDPRGWKEAIARELGTGGDTATIVVAHSVGAALVLDFLAEAEAGRQISAAFLIAPPFIGDGGWPSDGLRPTKQAAAEIRDRVPLYLYFGADDGLHGNEFWKIEPDVPVGDLNRDGTVSIGDFVKLAANCGKTNSRKNINTDIAASSTNAG